MSNEESVREAVRQLKARYFRLLDEKRWDEWRDLFTADAVIDTQDDGIADPIIGGEAFVALLQPLLDGVTTVHHGHMPEIAVEGADRAAAVWSMEDHLFWPDDAGGMHMWGTGWYEEEYVRGAAGDWRIAGLKLRRNHVEVDGKQVFPKL